LFVFSFLFSNLFESSIAYFLEQLDLGNENMQKTIVEYTNAETKLNLKTSTENTNWYVAGNEIILKNTIIWIFISRIFFNLRNRIVDSDINRFDLLLKLTLIFSIFSFFLATQSSGGRFLAISEYLMLSYCIIIGINSDNFKLTGQTIIVLMFAFVVIIRLRIMFDFLGITTLFGGLFIKLFFEDDYTIVNFLKIFIPSF
jgi:hypothetical protein